MLSDQLKDEEIRDITVNDSMIYVMYSNKLILFKKQITEKLVILFMRMK